MKGGRALPVALGVLAMVVPLAVIGDLGDDERIERPGREASCEFSPAGAQSPPPLEAATDPGELADLPRGPSEVFVPGTLPPASDTTIANPDGTAGGPSVSGDAGSGAGAGSGDGEDGDGGTATTVGGGAGEGTGVDGSGNGAVDGEPGSAEDGDEDGDGDDSSETSATGGGDDGRDGGSGSAAPDRSTVSSTQPPTTVPPSTTVVAAPPPESDESTTPWWLLLLVVAAAIAAALAMAVIARRQRDRAGSGGDGENGDGTGLLVRARRLAPTDPMAGLRAAFVGGLRRLDSAGLHPYDPSVTSGRISEHLHAEGFTVAARIFDEVFYGGRTPDQADVDAVVDGFDRTVGSRDGGAGR